MTDREPDVGEFVCRLCGALVAEHDLDGLSECPQCVDEAERDD